MNRSSPRDPGVTPAVVDGVRRRDPDAVQAAYEALSGPVFSYVQRLVRDPVWAEDLTADVFLEVVRGAAGFDGDPAGFRSWVFRIAHNLYVDHVRRETRRRHQALEELEEAGTQVAGADDPADEALSAVERDRIIAAVDELPPDQREVILLRLVADLPIAETARIAGKTEGAVKSLQHRGLRSLARRLRPDVQTPGEP